MLAPQRLVDLFKQWHWNEIYDFSNVNSFEWKYDVTPFSNLEFVGFVWVLYFSVILMCKHYMSQRSTAFSLKYVVAFHNLILCVWSLLMFLWVTNESIQSVNAAGIKSLFCVDSSQELIGRMQWGIYIFYISKFYELLDTIWLVLKKKPVIFLHWYHHAVVIAMVWSWLQYGAVYCIIGMMFNAGIHVFMYFYYMMSALKFNVWFKKFVTTGQIIQFVTSFVLCAPYFYYHYFESQNGCKGHYAFLFSMANNFIFLTLFIRFFAASYNNRNKKEE